MNSYIGENVKSDNFLSDTQVWTSDLFFGSFG